MVFSKFEFRQIESFQYIGGYVVWTVQKKQARDTLFWIVGVARMLNWALRSNLHGFGNISIYLFSLAPQPNAGYGLPVTQGFLITTTRHSR
jgi:hypothetical protein